MSNSISAGMSRKPDQPLEFLPQKNPEKMIHSEPSPHYETNNDALLLNNQNN